MNLKTLEILNLPPWMTLKRLALAAAGASALSTVLLTFWALYVVSHGLVFAFLCNLAQASTTAASAAFFYVFWRKAR